jgi:4-amino-4-deoxy-L-arabinose transferase-like glycosyltransferase
VRAGRSPWAAVLGLLALGLLLYLPALGVELLRHPLEAKYALAAREMLRGGPLLVAHLFGGIYPDKPPLYFWTTAALGWLTGGRIDEATARLPAVLAALAGLLATARLGADLFGGRAGVISAVVLATSGLFFWYARQGHPDQLLTTWTVLAVLGLWRSLAAPPGRSRVLWTTTAYAAMALGVLSKGLLGLILPLLGMAAYLVMTGPLHTVPMRLRLTPGLVVFALIVLGWYAPAVAREGRGYFYETLVHQQLVRYARSWVHRGPWYYYLGEFTTGAFPWSLWVPSALVLGWRARRETAAGEVAGLSPVLLPVAWFVTGFVFFSLSSSKRGAYLLPIYPAAALLVGWLWDRALAAARPSRWVTLPLVFLSAVAGLLAIGVAVVPRRLVPGRMVDTMVPSDPVEKGVLVALLLAGALAVWWPWRRGRRTVALGLLVTVQAVALLLVAVVRAPQYEARFPARELAARVVAATPPGESILSLLGDYDFIVAFYLDRPLTPLPGPPELLAARRPDGPRFALVDDDHEAVLEAPGVTALVEGQLGPKRIILVRLDPGPR